MTVATRPASGIELDAWLNPTGSQTHLPIPAIATPSGGIPPWWLGGMALTVLTTAPLQAAVSINPTLHPWGTRVGAPAMCLGLTSKVSHSVGTNCSGELLLARDHLAIIDEYFAIPVARIAEILGVTRPTIYAWRRGDVQRPADELQAKRLAELAELARNWAELSATPLTRFLTLPFGDEERSLLDLLDVPEWDTPAIDHALRVLAEAAARTAAMDGQEHSTGTLEQVAQNRMATWLAIQGV